MSVIDTDLGGTLRSLRRERGLTLVELAARCELSQPFLSQIETGRAQPSMDSVFRIARALGTTPQALFGRSTSVVAPTVIRRSTPVVPVLEHGVGSALRVLLPGAAPFHVLEFDGLPAEFGEPWSHAGFEAIYVVSGQVELDLDGELCMLEAGDFASYASTTPHRHRSVSGDDARLLLVEASGEPAQSSPQAHAAPT